MLRPSYWYKAQFFMKVSLISTVLNEAENLRPFLDALLGQSRQAEEIIIVDGGSQDGTIAIIETYIQEGAPIRLIQAPGANISQGRNQAISQASGDIISATDAGATDNPDWLKEITAPFADPSVDVSSGISRASAEKGIQQGVGFITLPADKDISIQAQNPSSRSIAFQKKIWEKTGGYPEELDSAEDSLFNHRLRAAGACFKFSPKAIIYWQPEATLVKASRQFFRYGRGDGRALLFPRIYATIGLKTALVLLMVMAVMLSQYFWVLLIISLFSYYLRQLWVNRQRCGIAAGSLVFGLRILLDTARLMGYVYGKWSRSVSRD